MRVSLLKPIDIKYETSKEKNIQPKQKQYSSLKKEDISVRFKETKKKAKKKKYASAPKTDLSMFKDKKPMKKRKY